MRRLASEFDDQSAQVLVPVRTQTAGINGPVTMTPFLRTNIKTPRGLYAAEAVLGQTIDANATNVVEIVNDGGCDKLAADAVIVHAGTTYRIRGRLTVYPDKGTTTYLCVASQNPTT